MNNPHHTKHIFGVKKFNLYTNSKNLFEIGFIHQYSKTFVVVAEFEDENEAQKIVDVLNKKDLSKPIEPPFEMENPSKFRLIASVFKKNRD